MGTDRGVWVFGYHTIQVWLEDNNGCPLVGATSGQIIGFDPTSPDNPDGFFEWCYSNGATIHSQKTNTRRNVTGRPTKKLVPSQWEYDASVSEMFFAAAQEADFTDGILARGQRLRIVLRLDDPTDHDNPAIFELQHCLANSFQITGREADVVEGSYDFDAEDMKTYG